MFDYSKEPHGDYVCIDLKSFYASVEMVARGLNPMKTKLVVMSRAANTGSGLILAASPRAKKELGISNVSRGSSLPPPPPDEQLLIVPPRMNLYIKKNLEINNIIRRFVADEDLLEY